jgi:small subunit ribosomal protein S10e
MIQYACVTTCRRYLLIRILTNVIIVFIYIYLILKIIEGVIVAKKDTQAPHHPNIPDVPNLAVIQLMRGFASKGLVRENFAWRHFYWYLTNDGIVYLREYLHLPTTIVPATLKKTARTARPEPRRGGFGSDRPRRDFGREKGGYRGGEEGEKQTVAPVDYKPTFTEGAEQQQEGAPRGRGRGFAGGRGRGVGFTGGDRTTGGRGVRND